MYRLRYFYKNGKVHETKEAKTLEHFAKAIDKIKACHACMRKFEKVQILKNGKLLKEYKI
jgi:hypothetical protein